MARVEEILVDTSLKIYYKTGIDAKGTDVIKNETLADLNLLATDKQLITVVDAIETLLAHSITEIRMIETHLLSQYA